MAIQFFCTRWGSEHLSWDVFCAKAKSAGYDGVEFGIAADTSEKELDLAMNTLQQQGLKIIPQHYDTVSDDFNKHLELFHIWLERLKPFPVAKINSQTGRDFFTFEQNAQLIELGNEYSVLHETHRGKFAFAAHITKTYLQSILELRLTLDVSHWICVAESFLYDQSSALDLAIQRTDHIHARVGFPEGPQVTDPRVPEHADTLHRHLEIWDRVVSLKSSQNTALTITTEFGPPPYMILGPSTRLPVSDQWVINVFMMDMLRERYA
jgi:sugar phosphate isomerase/epimerase